MYQLIKGNTKLPFLSFPVSKFWTKENWKKEASNNLCGAVEFCATCLEMQKWQDNSDKSAKRIELFKRGEFLLGFPFLTVVKVEL
jgi:hypothetical protein